MRWSICFGLLLVTSTSWAADPISDAQQLAQRALRAEADGVAVDRDVLLKQAMAAAPDEPLVRWLQGQLRSGKSWSTYDELTAKAKSSPVLQDYRERRDNSEPSLASQLQLAQFCQRKGLSQQASAHWSAVLEFDSDHPEARKQLGFEQLQGQWVRRHEALLGKEKADRVAATFKRLAPSLKGMVAQVERGELTHTVFVKRLREDTDVSAIPVWEAIVSPGNSAAATAVVAALQEMTDPEASLSLARHALWSRWPDVRKSAAAALRKRDENSYLPALLAELRGPWIGWREMATDGRNQLVYRYSIVADGADERTLRVLDQAYNLGGDRSRAAGLAAQSSRGIELDLEARRQHENELTRLHNENVMRLLAEVTHEESFDSPQDWWQWWDDRQEVYSAGGKPIEMSYAFRTTSITGRPPTSLPADRSTPVVREVKKDCLAGGTPILTQRGPVAVERVRIGDLVLAQHPETGELAMQPVLQTTVREPEPLIRLQLGEEKLRASGGHLFWISGKGWVRAREMKPGMSLHGLQGATAVTSISVEDKPTRTYNLVVGNFHSYFVEPGRVLSHDNSAALPTRAVVPGLTE